MTRELRVMLYLMALIAFVGAIVLLAGCGAPPPDKSEWEREYDKCSADGGMFTRFSDGSWECVLPPTEET